jgi:hypothetical protein
MTHFVVSILNSTLTRLIIGSIAGDHLKFARSPLPSQRRARTER